MPRLSALGSALMGVAGVPLSINGSTPATFTGIPSGYWQWLTNTLIVGQADFGGGFHLYTYDVGSTALTLINTNGANWNIAGGGVWAAWLGGTGVYTSIGALGPFPSGGVIHGSYAGELALIDSRPAASGLKVYNNAGTLIDAVSGTLAGLPPNDGYFLRDGVMTYTLGAGFLLRDYLAQTNLSLLQVSNMGNWMCPMFDGTDYWLLERTTADSLTLRMKDSTTAWHVIPGPSSQIFNPEVMLLSAGVARIAWSLTIGEEAAQLMVMDLTLATGANTVATVVAGALVFVPQADLSTITVTGTLSPGGGGGGGGGGTPGPGSPGRAVINARVAPPPPVREPRVYPHVPKIPDYHTQQSVRLAWDQLSGHQEQLTAQAATIASQQTQIDELKAALADLTQTATVTFKGAQDV